jgi:hypothetical protein
MHAGDEVLSLSLSCCVVVRACRVCRACVSCVRTWRGYSEGGRARKVPRSWCRKAMMADADSRETWPVSLTRFVPTSLHACETRTTHT